jgi:hypothetical protein
MKIDFNQIDNVTVEGIDIKDHPDFSDAFISDCDINGEPATESQLNEINENGEFINEQVFKTLY